MLALFNGCGIKAGRKICVVISIGGCIKALVKWFGVL